MSGTTGTGSVGTQFYIDSKGYITADPNGANGANAQASTTQITNLLASLTANINGNSTSTSTSTDLSSFSMSGLNDLLNNINASFNQSFQGLNSMMSTSSTSTSSTGSTQTPSLGVDLTNAGTATQGGGTATYTDSHGNVISVSQNGMVTIMDPTAHPIDPRTGQPITSQTLPQGTIEENLNTKQEWVSGEVTSNVSGGAAQKNWTGNDRQIVIQNTDGTQTLVTMQGHEVNIYDGGNKTEVDIWNDPTGAKGSSVTKTSTNNGNDFATFGGIEKIDNAAVFGFDHSGNPTFNPVQLPTDWYQQMWSNGFAYQASDPTGLPAQTSSSTSNTSGN